MHISDVHIFMHILDVRILMHMPIFDVHIFMLIFDWYIFLHISDVHIHMHVLDVHIFMHGYDAHVSRHVFDAHIFVHILRVPPSDLHNQHRNTIVGAVCNWRVSHAAADGASHLQRGFIRDRLFQSNIGSNRYQNPISFLAFTAVMACCPYHFCPLGFRCGFSICIACVGCFLSKNKFASFWSL